MSEDEIQYVDIEAGPVSGGGRKVDCRCSRCRKSIPASGVVCSKCTPANGNLLHQLVVAVVGGIAAGTVWMAFDRFFPPERINDKDIEKVNKIMNEANAEAVRIMQDVMKLRSK